MDRISEGSKRQRKYDNKKKADVERDIWVEKQRE